MEPNDFRFVLAEKGLDEVRKTLNALRIQKRKEFAVKLEEIASKLQGIRYCYMQAEEVAKLDDVLEISKISRELGGVVQQRDFPGLTSRYWLEYLEKLPELIGRGEISSPSK